MVLFFNHIIKSTEFIESNQVNYLGLNFFISFLKIKVSPEHLLYILKKINLTYNITHNTCLVEKIVIEKISK
jgi:hypothetical protein